ncbi:hypothetical protein XPA_001699 [Xanthoria parietina]
MDPCGLKAYSFVGNASLQMLLSTASIPFPTQSVDWGNPSSDCESITIQLSRLIHQEKKTMVKICNSTRLLSLGACSAVSYPSDHLVAKGVCISPNNMYGDALRFLFQ